MAKSLEQLCQAVNCLTTDHACMSAVEGCLFAEDNAFATTGWAPDSSCYRCRKCIDW